MFPPDLFDLFLDKDILALIATRSCKYAMAQFGMPVSISSDDTRVISVAVDRLQVVLV
jgi:hypothetical protein